MYTLKLNFWTIELNLAEVAERVAKNNAEILTLEEKCREAAEELLNDFEIEILDNRDKWEIIAKRVAEY